VIDNVISISVKKKEILCSKQCKHRNISIDQSLYYVKCDDCGEMIDPVYFLHSLALEENHLKWRITELKEELEKLSQKTKCKCDHCGKMTRI